MKFDSIDAVIGKTLLRKRTEWFEIISPDD